MRSVCLSYVVVCWLPQPERFLVCRYGDGWNSAYLYIGDTTVTLEDGTYGNETVCLEPGTYSPYACGGTFPSEVAWRVAGISGGAEDCTFTTTSNYYYLTDYNYDSECSCTGNSPGSFTVTAGTTPTFDDDTE